MQDTQRHVHTQELYKQWLAVIVLHYAVVFIATQVKRHTSSGAPLRRDNPSSVARRVNRTALNTYQSIKGHRKSDLHERHAHTRGRARAGRMRFTGGMSGQ